MDTIENKQMYLSDSSKITKDAFGVHSEIANTLFNVIENHEIPKESFTIGLFGNWGAGKSFIINKLKSKIPAQGRSLNAIIEV